MSDPDEEPVGNPEVDADPDIETSTATKATRTTITTKGTPGGVLRALLAHAVTTSTTFQTSFMGTSFPNPPPAPPNQHVFVASEIYPRLFISDIFTALNVPALRSSRITHVISVVEYAITFPTLYKSSPEPELCVFPELDLCSQPPPQPTSLQILHVPLADFPEADIFSHFSTTRDFITTALKDENARVLVHCYKGQSRSPTIVAAYLISTLKISTSDAVKTIQAKRPMALPNRGFRRQLEQWEVVVREEDEMVCSEK